MNNKINSLRKAKNIKPSRSHGNLNENRFYMSDDPEVLTKERKNLVKRTKSFWKFGKNTSDNEILEGMALWKHRDLVDVNNEKPKMRRKINSQERIRKPSRDKSNDSDRTINNNNINTKDSIIGEKQKEGKKSKEVRHSKSFNEKQNHNISSRKVSKIEKDEFENSFTKTKKPSNLDHQFYDDDGDGLMLKTVNRKNILQQYTNDSSGTDSEQESDMTSDDPYDSIVVDDQKVNKNESQFPNVAELGKKLEKLSKTSKYSPNKENNLNNQTRNTVQEKNIINMRLERNNSVKQNNPDNEDIIQYQDKRHTNSFKTFGIEVQNNENGEKERIDKDRYYSQTHNKRNKETTAQEKRRYYAESNNRSNSVERRGRPSYESIDSDRDNRTMTNSRRSHTDSDKRDKMKYYDSPNDELSDAVENRQFLPRTKLTKTNSNNSSQSKYEQDIGLMEYGETLQKRLKNPEYNSKYDEKSPHNGNMYGPWYDLWGLDSTSTSPRK
ncbi:hypothetical protein NQ314_009782 [Rhamnusium bicolor]|uniref:Uncharacterized protein n=1 Tax=Rhamnusium bicolor TaxID=1586634 RepID=A0AAV8XWL6_9CUCU|nr:hypothetical protein NQ314_009782 [Rhamnusium bicolor]